MSLQNWFYPKSNCFIFYIRKLYFSVTFFLQTHYKHACRHNVLTKKWYMKGETNAGIEMT